MGVSQIWTHSLERCSVLTTAPSEHPTRKFDGTRSEFNYGTKETTLAKSTNEVLMKY